MGLLPLLSVLNETRTLQKDSHMPGTGHHIEQAHGTQKVNQMGVGGGRGGCSGLWEDEWATANHAEALGASLAEGTVVPWPGHLEMNSRTEQLG